MDRTWIKLNDFTSKDYVDGVKSFMKFARQHIGGRTDMPCPCRVCLNQILHPPYLVKFHLLVNGIDVDYSEWVYHGETSDQYLEDDEFDDNLDETFEEEEMSEDLNFGNVTPKFPGKLILHFIFDISILDGKDLFLEGGIVSCSKLSFLISNRSQQERDMNRRKQKKKKKKKTTTSQLSVLISVAIRFQQVDNRTNDAWPRFVYVSISS